MAEKNRTLVHPNAIAYDSDSGDRPLHYFRRWRHLTLTFEDYSVSRSVSSLKVDGPGQDDKSDHIVKKAIEHGFDALTEQEQEFLHNHQLTYIQPADEPERLRLQGWARIEGSRLITVLSIPDEENSLKQDEGCDQSFGRLKVHILSAGEDHHGSLLLWTEDLRQYDTDPNDPDEDYLIAELYIAHTKLLKFLQDLSPSEAKLPLTIHTRALLFQDEVEEALSEPWHSQRYALIRGGSAPIIIESLDYPVVGTSPAVELHEDHEANGILDLTAERTESRHEPKQKRHWVAKELLGLKRAVWLLAAAIILAAVIT